MAEVMLSPEEVGRFVICPLCDRKCPVGEFAGHLRDHGVSFEAGTPRGRVGGLAGVSWGRPFWELRRALIPREKWETAEIHHGEANHSVTYKGQPVRLEAKASQLMLETRRQFRRNGIDPRYIHVVGNRMRVQFTGSPIHPALVALLVIAIIALIISVAVRVAVDAMWEVVPLPDWLRPAVGLAILGFAMFVAYKLVVGRRGT